jgi:hypothetical protein
MLQRNDVNRGTPMHIFKNDDEGYLEWVAAHPFGYIVNVDEPQQFANYPMIHGAAHKAMTSSKRSNYTTHQYYKVCGTSLPELEAWSQATFGRKLIRCKVQRCQDACARGDGAV